MNILIVGSNGLVGKDLLRLFNNYIFKKDYTLTICNTKEVRQFYYKNKCSVECNNKSLIECLEKLDDYDYIFNCANEEVSKKIIDKIGKSIYIDNSSYLRRKESIPLVVPEINFVESQIYANPNCTTIILTLFLNSILSLKPKNINVSTYQALSGAGKEKLEKFIDDYKNIKSFDFDIPSGSDLSHNKLGFNFYPHESNKLENGFSGEEDKVMFETKKILNLEVFITCIRVPVIRCHGESVSFELEDEISRKDLIEIIKQNENIIYDDDLDSISTEFLEKIKVGHLRQNPFNKKIWNCMITGDQLTRGASYNAFKIFLNNLE